MSGADGPTPAPDPGAAEGTPRRRWGAALTALLVLGLYGGMIGMARADRMQLEQPPPMAMAGGAAAVALDDVPVAVAASYEHATAHAHVYRAVPCYCGCDSFADHANLFDCFVRPDGARESHAAGCGVCLAEAEKVRRLLDVGTEPDDVRAAVVEQFGPSTNPQLT